MDLTKHCGNSKPAIRKLRGQPRLIKAASTDMLSMLRPRYKRRFAILRTTANKTTCRSSSSNPQQ